jgi:hypothetical protein
VSPNAHAAQNGVVASTCCKRMRSEEAEAPELVQLRKSNQVRVCRNLCWWAPVQVFA